MANVTGNNTFNNISITGLDDVIVDTLTATTITTTDIDIVNTTNPFLTIANYAFDTPVRTLNAGATVSSPYTAITGWTFTAVSGTVTYVATGRGFWDTLGPNSFVQIYPDYPTVTQCICIQQNTISQFRLSQTLNVPTSGVYIVSFWIWGRYVNYRVSQTINVSFGSSNSGNVICTEQFWKKVEFKTYCTSGANTLNVLFAQTQTLGSGVNSGICFTNVQVQAVNGLIVSDSATSVGNSNIITPKELNTNGIYNRGQIWNYGQFTQYGPFIPLLDYIENSAVIGDCKFGQNPADTGENTYLIGQGIGTNISSAYLVGNLTNVIAIGTGAMEQASTASDIVAIGRFACRYSGSNLSICIGTNAGQFFGYQGATNQFYNIAIGPEAMGAVYTQFNQYNVAIGSSVMRTGGDFTDSRSFNSIVGHLSGYALKSNNHSVLGYNSFRNNNSLGSGGCVAIGANAGNTSTTQPMLNTTLIGNATDLTSNFSCNNSTAIGAYARIQESDTIEMGGANQTTGAFPAVVIPNKVKLQTNVLVGSVSTYNITFRTPENIIITNSITGTINLPIPTALAIGTRFTIYRGYSSPATTIFITAQGGVNILYDGTTSSGFYDMGVESFITLVLVATTGNAWVLTGKSQINELPNAGYYPGTTDNSYFGTEYNNTGSDHTIMGVEAGMNLDSSSASNAFYGNQAGRSMTSGSSSVAVGQLALSENTIGFYNTAVGYSAGRDCKNTGNTLIGFASAQTSILIDYCTAIGTSVAIAENVINSTGIGTNAVVSDSNTIVLGGALSGTYPTVIIPEKSQLKSRVSVGVVASYTITYPIPEVIILTSATTVTINLPTPQSPSVGASFYIIRAFATGLAPSITIQATAGINIAGNGVVANTYTYTGLETMLFVTLIGTAGTAWSVSGRTLDENVADEIYAPQSNFNFEHYIDFSFQSATVNSYVGVNTDTELRYNPSLNRLSVPNIRIPDKQEIQTRVMAGAIASYSLTFPLPQELIIDSTTTTSVFLPTASTANIGASVSISRRYQVATNPIIIEISAAAGETIQGWDNAPASNSIFMNSTITSMRCIVNANGQWTAVYSRNEGQLQQAPMRINDTGTTTETIVSPFYKIYPFTCKAGAFIFNLPTLTAEMVGFQFDFKRAGGTYNAITFNPSSVVPTGVFGLGGTAFGTTGSSVLIGATQNSLTLFVSQTQNEFTGTFTNTAGATSITIVSLPTTQAIFVGGYINLNGNFRYITGDGGGRGGVGAYNINTAIAGANTGQPFTAYVSYGWMVMNQG